MRDVVIKNLTLHVEFHPCSYWCPMSSLQCTLVSLTHQPLVLVTPVWGVVSCQGVSTRHRDSLRVSSRVSVPGQYWGRGSSRRTLTYQVLFLSFCHSNCRTSIVVVDGGRGGLNYGCGLLWKLHMTIGHKSMN